MSTTVIRGGSNVTIKVDETEATEQIAEALAQVATALTEADTTIDAQVARVDGAVVAAAAATTGASTATALAQTATTATQTATAATVVATQQAQAVVAAGADTIEAKNTAVAAAARAATYNANMVIVTPSATDPPPSTKMVLDVSRSSINPDTEALPIVDVDLGTGQYRYASLYAKKFASPTTDALSDKLANTVIVSDANAGIIPLTVWRSSVDPNNVGVVVEYVGTDGRVHDTSPRTFHDVQLPGFNAVVAPIATPSVLKDSGGAVIPVSSNDNDGQRKYNQFSEPNTWYVFGWAGQSLNGGQASLLHIDPSLSDSQKAAITTRTYTPLTTIEQNLYPANLLMPNVGSNIVGLTASITGFIPLVCYNKVPFGTLTQSGETPETQALYTMMALHRADFPNDPVPTFIAINYAVGSSSILNLGPGRPAWTDMQAAVQKITDLGMKAGKRVVFVSEHYRGFEADWDIPRHADLANSDPNDPTIINGRERETLMRMLANRRAQLDEYLRPITGQARSIRMFTDQVQIGASSYTASREPRATGAQLDVHMFDPLCVALGSKGAIPANVLDFIHPSPHGYSWMGKFDGYLMYRHLCTINGHQPLKAYRFSQTGPNTYDVYFNRHIQILQDDTVVNITDLGAGKGLQIIDSTGAIIPIASVQQGAPNNRVTITTDDSAAFTATFTAGSTTSTMVTSAPTGTVRVGQIVTAPGLAPGVKVLSASSTVANSYTVSGLYNIASVSAVSVTPRYGAPRLNISLVSSGNRRGNKTGARSAIVSYFALGTMPAPPTFSGEVNDEGTPWPSYPNPLPIYEMAAHQQIALT